MFEHLFQSVDFGSQFSNDSSIRIFIDNSMINDTFCPVGIT